MPLVSGRNRKRTFNKSNLNQVLSAARKAVAEGRAREENLQEQLDKVLKEKADLEKAFENERLASTNSHKNEKSQLESAIREEKAAVERSLKEEKAALEKLINIMEDEMKELHWYDEKMIRIHMEGTSMNKIHRDTDIGLTSIKNTIKNGKARIHDRLREDWEDFSNGDYDQI